MQFYFHIFRSDVIAIKLHILLMYLENRFFRPSAIYAQQWYDYQQKKKQCQPLKHTKVLAFLCIHQQ